MMTRTRHSNHANVATPQGPRIDMHYAARDSVIERRAAGTGAHYRRHLPVAL